MLIALLLVLGVNLVVIVALGVAVVGRRRWVLRRKGVFAGKIRVGVGELDGLTATWKGGFGYWVGGVLVWARAPLLFRSDAMSLDRLLGQREATAADGKRLGKDPVVIQVSSDTATVEVAAQAGDRAVVVGAMATRS